MSRISRSPRFWLAVILAALALAGLAGCEDNPQAADTQKVPWDRPGSWEGGLPGMSGEAPKY